MLERGTAATERHSRHDLADIATTARRDASGWILDGEKGVVLHGDSADRLIVTARIGGGQRVIQCRDQVGHDGTSNRRLIANSTRPCFLATARMA